MQQFGAPNVANSPWHQMMITVCPIYHVTSCAVPGLIIVKAVNVISRLSNRS